MLDTVQNRPAPNRTNILRLITQLEELQETNPDKFSMCYYRDVYATGHNHYCATPSCIAGWAAWLSLDQPTPEDFSHAKCIPSLAAAWLGLDYTWALSTLFEPSIGVNYETITISDALLALTFILDFEDEYTSIARYDLWDKAIARAERQREDYDRSTSDND